jgi:hypothetical protein
MRTIGIETDTYSAVWADRQPGEETEDAIIRRKFGVKAPAAQSEKKPAKIGFSDYRFNINLAEGFEIFRTYKGTEYRAIALNGQWKMSNTGIMYPSLNQLSRAVSGNVENAWNNWYYLDPSSGRRRLVNELRSSSPTLPRIDRRI